MNEFELENKMEILAGLMPAMEEEREPDTFMTMETE